MNFRDYMAFRFGCGLVYLSVVLAFVFVVFVVYTVKGISREVSFHNRYGADWQEHFEQQYGPVATARQKTIATGAGAVFVPSMAFWIYRLLRKDPSKSNAKKRQKERRMSNTERVIRARRNALVGNFFGMAGILFSIALAVFRWGIFERHSEEVVLAIFVFIVSYCSVLAGCWWWLQAKFWPEPLMLVGVAPLIIACIPFVRLIYLASPMILPAAMVMAPAILLTVVAVLPDKSCVGKKPRTWNYKGIGKQDR